MLGCGVSMATPKVWHPSDVWEWYRKGDRHHDNGKGFITYPDYEKLKKKIDKLNAAIEIITPFLEVYMRGNGLRYGKNTIAKFLASVKNK